MERGTPRVAEPRQSSLIAGTFDPPRMAPDFSLAGSDGSQVSLARYHGKIVLLTFGFTHCAAVCPTTLATLAQARAELGKAADAVQVIYVTVDPERDDVAHMKPLPRGVRPSLPRRHRRPPHAGLGAPALWRDGHQGRQRPRLCRRPYLVDLPGRSRRPVARPDAVRA